MSWISDDREHEGWAAPELPDGRLGGGALSDGSALGERDSGPWPWRLADVGPGKSRPDGRTAIGWRGLCICGWRGPLWRRVPEPESEHLDDHLIWAEPDEHGEPGEAGAGENIRDLIYAEWLSHVPAASLAEVKAAAAGMSAAEQRLSAAVRAARADGRSWDAIGRAADVSRQTAYARWGKTTAAPVPVPVDVMHQDALTAQEDRSPAPEPAGAGPVSRHLELVPTAAEESSAEAELPAEPEFFEHPVISDEERSASLHHRTLDGGPPGYTYTVDEMGHTILWFQRTTRAGGAERNWPRPGWIPLNRYGIKSGPGGHKSRVKALRDAAGSYEYGRRKETPAGKDVPLKEAAGWALRQTLADKDERRYQVIGPDGSHAGTVSPAYRGAKTWSAVAGKYTTVTPMDIPGSESAAASGGEDWRTRTAAALAVAWWRSEGATPAPGEKSPDGS